MKSMRLNVTIKSDIVERMDSYAKDNGMTRSALISIAVSQYLNAVEAMPSVQKLLAGMSEIVQQTAKGQLPPADALTRLEGIQDTYGKLVK